MNYFLLSNVGDIIIERWLPYENCTSKRSVKIIRAPSFKYPDPFHELIVYDNVRANIVRKFTRLGVTQEDPETYRARYGSTLLDRSTLLRRVREAGIVENIVISFVKNNHQNEKNLFHLYLS